MSAGAGGPCATAPEPGELVAVAPGIHWAQIPIPGMLRTVNVWLFEDDDGWTVLDCGSDTPAGRAAWDALLAGPLGGERFARIVVSHAHHDHIGLAGPIARRLGVAVWTSGGEWQAALRRRQEATAGYDGVIAYYRSLGCTEADAHGYIETRATGTRNMTDLPEDCILLGEGEEIRLAGRSWRVMTGGGHSPEHVVLHCMADGILVTGDQLLPRITPFIGVDPSDPFADPLGSYFAALDRFAAIDDGTLVLPGHGMPFAGPASRAAETRLHHERRLAAIEAETSRPRTGYDVARVLFPRAMGGAHERLAISETVAHLNHAVVTGRLTRETGADGVHRYVTA